MAVALAGERFYSSSFVSLSGAAHIVERFGYSVIPFVSQAQSGLPSAEWHRRFAIFMHGVLRQNRPDMVVFDGSYVYRGVIEATRRADVPLIWLRRGLWKEGTNTTQAADETIAWRVIEPGDIATNDDKGPLRTVQPNYATEPITLYSPQKSLSRELACSELGLDARKHHILIQLGAGNINNIEDVRARAVEIVNSLGAPWNPVVATSPLADKTPSDLEATGIQEYPLAPVLAAFHFGVIAGGYNSIHEAASAGLPCVVIPNDSTATDNQRLRAEIFARDCDGIVASSAEDVEEAIRVLTVRSLQPSTGGRRFEGADQTSTIIADVIRRG
ncbi:glycosyltransferase [Arthrobacter tumbae]|uniref:glycosyltransferase n=1 Tax=Arthrobacter tumbae TaxID=163874 RepID=UPI00195ED2F6|nr:glycosyltransferase [Arthrobacter tumbae]MBM7782544.1 hypothetical protein [Arthrobacter tumbae]